MEEKLYRSKKSSHEINIFNPNIEIQNILELESSKQFNGVSKITYFQDKIEYKFSYNNMRLKFYLQTKKTQILYRWKN